jgi:hypothetical protein
MEKIESSQLADDSQPVLLELPPDDRYRRWLKKETESLGKLDASVIKR